MPQFGRADDRSVVVCTGTNIHGVDFMTGTEFWSRPPATSSPNTQWFTPAVSASAGAVVVLSAQGDLMCLDLASGEPRWAVRIPFQAMPPVILGDQIYIAEANASGNVHVFAMNDGAGAPAVSFGAGATGAIVVGNGIAFVPAGQAVTATDFGEQQAALFDAPDARIMVQADGTEFDFGKADFTVEAWICTTAGGVIVSGHPTAADSDNPQHHGFAFGITAAGELRFGVMNDSFANMFGAQTGPTAAADGAWHHVAAVRRKETVELYLDGISQAQTPVRSGAEPLDVSGKLALTFGVGFMGGVAEPDSEFRGLLREVRIWSVGLETAALQGHMKRMLTGTEPQLLGYWRLDDPDPTQIENQVPFHNFTASRQNVQSIGTILDLDDSAFPYHLAEVRKQWPFSGHWAARGADRISFAPAVSGAGTAAFTTDNEIYGVDAHDGSRLWGVPLAGNISAPVARRDAFYALDGSMQVVRIDARTGALTQVAGFDGLIAVEPSGEIRLSAPACDGRLLAAASPDGHLRVLTLASERDAAPKVVRPTRPVFAAAPGDLTLAGGVVYAVAGSRLYRFDPATQTTITAEVAGNAFVIADKTLFAVTAPGTVTAFAADTLASQRSYQLPSGHITGLDASADAALAVATADDGNVYGLSFALALRWQQTLPSGDAVGRDGAKRQGVNPPVIVGRDVLCTSQSGAVAALGVADGALHSLYFTPAPVMTSAVPSNGTVYFGCGETPPTAPMDGGLHSVVLGSSYALRLGVNEKGEPDDAPADYVQITAGGTMPLNSVDYCSVEAWVNTLRGGTVFAVAPSLELGLRPAARRCTQWRRALRLCGAR